MTVYEGLLKLQPMEPYDFAQLTLGLARQYRSAEMVAELEGHLNSELSPERVAILEGMLQEKFESHIAAFGINKWYRFEPLTEDPAELEKLNRMLFEKNISRQDLALILFNLRIRPGFGKKDFGI